MSASLASLPPPRLNRRPDATAYQVDELLFKVGDGQVRIPRFQRSFKWGDEDRLALFDSIYRGYPVGTLLLWKRQEEAGEVQFGSLTIKAGGRSDALSIVDGQQRITTLAEALLQPPAPNERAIHFDPSAETFRYERVPSAGAAKAYASRSIPVFTLLSFDRLAEWLIEQKATSQFRNQLVKVYEQIRTYKIPVYIVETDNADVLREIFSRANQAGKALEKGEVFEALFGSLTHESPSSLSQISASLEALGFGKARQNIVLQALLAVRGLPPHRDFKRLLTQADVPAALRDTEAAMRQAVVFLQRDAGIPHNALLPYDLPLIALSLFFHRFREPHARSRVLLRRWVWRSALAQKLKGDTANIRHYLESIREDDEHSAVQRLLGLASDRDRRTEEAFSLSPFSFGTARGKLQCCALASLGPRDLHTGAPLDLGSLLSASFTKSPASAAKPAADLASPVPSVIGARQLDGADPGLANRLLHPPLRPASALRTALMSTEDARTLASHAVSPEAQRALRASDHAAFLTERERVLKDLIEAYFRRQAEWDADDSPPLDSLLIEED